MSHPAHTPIFLPLWRRKWLILAVGVMVAAASYLYYKHKHPTYGTSTEVYLGAAAEEELPGSEKGIKNQGVNVENQSALINSLVGEEVRRRLRAEHKGALLLGSKVKAKSPEKSDFITISTEAKSARAAVLLANLTARTYVTRVRLNHQRAVERAIEIARRQLRRLEAGSALKTLLAGSKSKSSSAASGTSNILQETSLNAKINELESSLGVSGAEQIKPAKATSANLLSPKPRKDAIFGFVIGVVLAAIAAYALSLLDRRLRSLADIEALFESQILTALPKAGNPIVKQDGIPRPSRVLLEPLRRLSAALELGGRLSNETHGSGRVILFTSSDPGDGKSTLLADLALVQREAGERVMVVEANFRRPVQSRLLGVDSPRGLADVLAGGLSIEDAAQRVRPPAPAGIIGPGQSGGGGATVVAPPAGALFLLAGAESVANPPATLAQAAMPELLSSLAADFDSVLIDAPSPLEFSDVMPLLSIVGGIVIVARVGHTREGAARRMMSLLRQLSSAPVLGVAANCAARVDSERYGFTAANGRVRPLMLIRR